MSIGYLQLAIDASVNRDNSDKVLVYGEFTGEQFIALNNIGSSADGALGTVVASVNKGNGIFKAVDGEGTLFYERYELDQKETEDESGYFTKDWYLKKAEKVDPFVKPTTSVETVLATTAVNYHLWRNENDKLMQRMGELRHNGVELSGLWVRAKGTKQGRSGTFGFENNYASYELGYDRMDATAADQTRYRGVFFSYADGDVAYSGGDGENDNVALGVYQTHLWSDGRYLDSVLRISHLTNDFSIYDSHINHIKGASHNTGVALSVEAGWTNMLPYGWYVEPQGQFSLGYLDGAKYRTNNEITVEQGRIISAISRVGFNVGRAWNEKNRFYAKANVLHEFGADYDVDMKHSQNHLSIHSDFKDTWFEYGIGSSLTFNENTHVSFDVERSTGGNFSKHWGWNVEFRYCY